MMRNWHTCPACKRDAFGEADATCRRCTAAAEVGPEDKDDDAIRGRVRNAVAKFWRGD